MSQKKAVILIADGSEEMEAVIAIDVLRRLNIFVTVASCENDLTVKCSRDVVLKADTLLNTINVEDYDCIILPGGMKGAIHFESDPMVSKLLKEFETEQKIIAAICAAPIALEENRIFTGKSITSHPSVRNQLTLFHYKNERVVKDGNLITSRGPGTAFEFSFEIARSLGVSDESIKETKQTMFYN